MGYWIVVVDDDAMQLSDARRLLTERDMRVSCMRSGEELLQFMEKNTPDLILLDILLEGIDGFETLRRLRSFENESGRSNTPVIFLTGDDDKEAENRGLQAGASDFIRKPFDREIFLRRIYNTIINSKTIEDLTIRATVDKLTGFLNKETGTERVAEMCSSETGAFMIFDLDSFKLVNDIYGHEMGDKVLEVFAKIFKRNITDDDVICRIGGDEFLAFLCSTPDEEKIAALIRTLNLDLEKACMALMGRESGIPAGISAGVALVPEHGTDFSLLFHYADGALRSIKQNGKHGYDIFKSITDSESSEKDLNLELTRLTKIVEERGDGRGALILGQDTFAANYHFVMRMIKRKDGRANKFLFELNPKEEGCDMQKIAGEFATILQNAIRRSDIIFHSKANQFFLLLPELSGISAPQVISRIMKAWDDSIYSNTVSVKYVMEEVSFYTG